MNRFHSHQRLTVIVLPLNKKWGSAFASSSSRWNLQISWYCIAQNSFFFFLYSLVCLFSFKVFYFFSPAERNSCIIRFYVLKISAPVFIYSRALVGLFMQFWSEFFQSRLVAWKYVQLCFKRIWHIVPHSNSMASYKRLQRKKNILLRRMLR